MPVAQRMLMASKWTEVSVTCPHGWLGGNGDSGLTINGDDGDCTGFPAGTYDPVHDKIIGLVCPNGIYRATALVTPPTISRWDVTFWCDNLLSALVIYDLTLGYLKNDTSYTSLGGGLGEFTLDVSGVDGHEVLIMVQKTASDSIPPELRAICYDP